MKLPKYTQCLKCDADLLENTCDVKYNPEEEMLVYTCKTCGYAWDGPCEDSVAEADIKMELKKRLEEKGFSPEDWDTLNDIKELLFVDEQDRLHKGMCKVMVKLAGVELTKEILNVSIENENQGTA